MSLRKDLDRETVYKIWFKSHGCPEAGSFLLWLSNIASQKRNTSHKNKIPFNTNQSHSLLSFTVGILYITTSISCLEYITIAHVSFELNCLDQFSYSA